MEIKQFKACIVGVILVCTGTAQAIPRSFAVTGGLHAPVFGNHSNVSINNDVTNNYNFKRNTTWQGVAGIELSQQLAYKLFSRYRINYGIAGYFLNLGKAQGIEHPLINFGLFDSLDYQFKTQSAALMVQTAYGYQMNRWQPFILVGIGNSWNRFSQYRERPTNPSLSASPAVLFNGHTSASFAYTLSVGTQFLLGKALAHPIEYNAAVRYQYFNLGSGRLGRAPLQTSDSRLQIKSLYTQGVLFSLIATFG
ncbi:MAG: hypothetical protein J0I93_03895 [Legionella sp.]|nr:hypothetical protein [Legionella sp.]